MNRADGMRFVRNARDTERMILSPVDNGESPASSSKTYVRVTGPKNDDAKAYPGVFVFRDLTVANPTDSGAWVDGEEVMVEEINNGTLVKDRRYECQVWGLKPWVDSTAEDEDDEDVLSWYVEVDANTSSPVSCSAACGWFAGATEYDCWTFTVVSASGNMDSLDLSQTMAMAWVADPAYPDGGYWECDTGFTICDFTGHVILWRDAEGEPQLKLVAANYVLTLSCCDEANQTLYFNGGNSGADVLCCARETNEGPAFNTFRVAVAWSRCPNPDYTTPGWYCVAVSNCAGTRECCLLSEDPGLGVILCSGPHADQATCAAACGGGGGGTVSNSCCTNIPETLFITFTGVLASLGTIPLTWVVGDLSWEGTGVACGGNNTIFWNCTSGNWSLEIVGIGGANAGYLSGAISAECHPFFAVSAVNNYPIGHPCAGNFGFFVTE